MKRKNLLNAALFAALPGVLLADPPAFQRVPAPAPAVIAPAQLAPGQQLAQVEKQIADLQNFLQVADLTEAAAKQYDAKLKNLIAQRDKLRAQLKTVQAVKVGAPVATPAERVYRAPNGKAFPKHWGAPPRLQTRDLRPLPGGYGRGSGTLARWIAKQLDLDAKNPNRGKGDKPVLAGDAGKVQTALEGWAKAKAKCGGNYEYTVGFTSAFGFGHTTTIVVKANKVVERRYEEFNRREPPRPGVKPPGFVEKGADVGKNKKGAPAKTLDEIYAQAGKVAAQALRPSERRYVRTDKNGLLTSCFIIDTRIADDAPRKGVAIGQIKLAVAGNAKIYKAPNGKAFPVHWGAPPRLQTRDFRPLPGGYGNGSSTLARWIQQNLDNDAQKPAPKPGGVKPRPIGRPVPPVRPPGLPVPPPRPPQLLGPPQRQPVGGDCAQCRTEAHQLHLGLAENGKTITVKMGVPVRVKLRGNPTTGFTWNDASPAGALKLLGKVAHQAGGRPGVLGAPGMSTATYATTALGKGKIVLEYKRVFEKKAPASTVRINIVVTRDGRVAKPEPGAAVLKEKLTLRDLQGGFAGFTGWLTTVNVDGTWTRQQVFNRQLRPAAQSGKLTATQIKSLQAALNAAEVAKLPAQIGNFRGANPHVVTLTIGNRQSVLTLPTGRPLPAALPGGKLDDTGRFVMVAQQLKGLKAGNAGGAVVAKPGFKAPNGKPYPAHWGAPPRLQTRDFRPLPGGYGNGSSTLAGWISRNMAKDAAAGRDPNVKPPNVGGNQPPAGANAAEIAKLQARIKQIKSFMARARLTKPARDRFLAEIAQLEKRIAELNAKPGVGAVPPPGFVPRPVGPPAVVPGSNGNNVKRPPVTAAFAAKHPAGSYAPGELLVGIQKGVAAADSQKELQKAIPGLVIVKAMFKGSILHVRLPANTNVERGMAASKRVKMVRYAELNGIARIQPVPQPQPRPGIGIRPVPRPLPPIRIQPLEPEPQLREER